MSAPNCAEVAQLGGGDGVEVGRRHAGELGRRQRVKLRGGEQAASWLVVKALSEVVDRAPTTVLVMPVSPRIW